MLPLGDRRFIKPAYLAIIPPYAVSAPPLGPASLLAYLQQQGNHDFGFLDFRLFAPAAYAPTFRPSGVFGETYVMDIPDLPLVLNVTRAFRERRLPEWDFGDAERTYCLERGINPSSLQAYLRTTTAFLARTLPALSTVRFFGFSVWTSNYLTTLIACAVLRLAKKPPTIVLGGPQTTESKNAAMLALRTGLVDGVALGEGEETLAELYRRHKAGTLQPGAEPVPGALTLAADGQTSQTAPRRLLKLSALPAPAFEHFPLASYQTHDRPYRVLPAQLTRGCTSRCAFCSEWVFWQRFRHDDVSHVLHVAAETQRRFGAEGLWFMDSLLNGSMDRLIAFAEGLLSRGLKLRWGGFMRAQMEKQTAELLVRAGLDFAFLGIESLSNETLASMNKNRTEADNVAALRAFLDAGTERVVAGFIPGFPGDTRERFLRTAVVLDEVRRAHPRQFRVNVEPFIVSPGQPLYQKLSDFGLEKAGWPAGTEATDPALADLIADVAHTVTGRNQGLDRLGQLRIAQTVNEVEQGSMKDPFAYAVGEQVTGARFHTVKVMTAWNLVRIKSETGLQVGWMLNDAELAGLEKLAAKAPSGAITASPEVQMYLTRVAAQHVLAAPLTLPRLYDVGAHALGGHLTLNPHAIVRVVRSVDGGSSCLVIDVYSGVYRLLPEAAAPMLRYLGTNALPVDGLEVALASRGFAPEALAELRTAGLVLGGAPAPEAAPVAPPAAESA